MSTRRREERPEGGVLSRKRSKSSNLPNFRRKTLERNAAETIDKRRRKRSNKNDTFQHIRAAGDHLKFTLTNAYAATMLGWGLLEYQDGVKEIGELTEYKNNLAWALDYVASCDLGDEIVYMIGDGAFDHVWWGSAEVYMRKFKLMKGCTYLSGNSCR